MAATATVLFNRRSERVRIAIRKNSLRPRLHVFRSQNHIYAQIIDDVQGTTLAAASTVQLKLKNGANIEAAKEIGKLIAQAAKKAEVTQVVFDKGGYKYHGRVKALADAARENGLEF